MQSETRIDEALMQKSRAKLLLPRVVRCLRKSEGSRENLLYIVLLATLPFLRGLDGLGAAQSAPSPTALTLKDASADNVEDDPKQIALFERDIEQGKFEETKGLLTDYLKSHPKSWKAHYQLGYILFRVHDVYGSIKALAKSLELKINNAEAHKILGLDFTIIDRDDLAEIELRQAALLKPDSAEIHYLFGRVYYSEGSYPSAKKELEEAVRLNPTYMKAYANLGLTLEGLGDNSAALKNYLKAIELDEQQRINSEWPYIDLASFYNRQHQPDLAQTYCQRAIEVNPKADQAYFQLAKAYQSLEKWEQAARALQKAIEINPRSASSHYVLSCVYREMGKLRESQEQVKIFEKLRHTQDTTLRPLGRGMGEGDSRRGAASDLSSDN